MEDDHSVYVGSLSFDTTESDLREKFEQFGSIQNAKIIVDRDSGNSRGYGFITFTNSRAASKAINGMDGGSLGGRIIKVNEVTKNGRNFRGDTNFRDRGRGRDGRDFRFRDRTGNARMRSPPRMRRLSPGALNSDRARSTAHHYSHSPQGGYSPSRSISPLAKRDNRSSSSHSAHSSDRLHAADAASERLVKTTRTSVKQREEDLVKFKNELDTAKKRRDELRNKVAGLENENAAKERELIDLRSKHQKLEEALFNARNATDQKKSQLRKLQKAFLQVKMFTECLQRSEKELQLLIDSVASELHGTAANEIHGSNALFESEDLELKDDDGCHVNIDD